MTTATPADLKHQEYTPAQQRAIDVFESARTHRYYHHLEVEAYRETFSCLSVSRQAAMHTLDYYVCMNLLLRGKPVAGASHDQLLEEQRRLYEANSLLRMELTAIADDYTDMPAMREAVKNQIHFGEVGFRKAVRKTVTDDLGTRLEDGTRVDLNVFTPYKETEQ